MSYCCGWETSTTLLSFCSCAVRCNEVTRAYVRLCSKVVQNVCNHNKGIFITKMLKLCCRLSLKTHRTRIGTITRALGQEINLKLNNVPLDKYLKHLQDQYLYIKQNKGSTATENQRLLELQPVMDTLNRRRCLVDNIASLKDLLSDEDEEIRTLAEAEKCSYNEEISKVEEELLELLMPNDVDDYRNSIHVEVKAGVGGQEAMLFAAELFQMYCNFGGYKGWDVQVADCEITEGGGVRHASALIEGKNSFRCVNNWWSQKRHASCFKTTIVFSSLVLFTNKIAFSDT